MVDIQIIAMRARLSLCRATRFQRPDHQLYGCRYAPVTDAIGKRSQSALTVTTSRPL